MIIYKATNKINGKCYIGQSAFSLERRKLDGVKIVIQNLREFCRKNNLNSGCLYNMCNNRRKSKYKGYWCERIEYSYQRKKELKML